MTLPTRHWDSGSRLGLGNPATLPLLPPPLAGAPLGPVFQPRPLLSLLWWLEKILLGSGHPQPLDASSPFLEIEEDGASSQHFAPPWPLAGAGGGDPRRRGRMGTSPKAKAGQGQDPPGGEAEAGQGQDLLGPQASTGGRLKTSAEAGRTGKNTADSSSFEKLGDLARLGLGSLAAITSGRSSGSWGPLLMGQGSQEKLTFMRSFLAVLSWTAEQTIKWKTSPSAGENLPDIQACEGRTHFLCLVFCRGGSRKREFF